VKLFGTDGIRGKAGAAPLDSSTIVRVGAALIRALNEGGRPQVLIGRDTRESGDSIERDLAKGLSSAGGRPLSVGVVPTPAVAYLTRTGDFAAGIVISASHNPYEDNGIKVFSGHGHKLDEAFEARIEEIVADQSMPAPAGSDQRAQDAGLRDDYIAHLKLILADAGPLRGSRIVLDCANGATVTVAPGLFRELGFDVVTIGDAPNGRNINLHCGSTHLELLQKTVVERGARLGVAFDGDGDRALFVDRRGRTIDGDAVLLMAAHHLKQHGRLPGNGVVATVMSNIGLELAMRERGIDLVRCAVGDKYVMEEMLRRGLALGGEQSGHIIFAEHLYTGDGIGTALQVLRIMAETGRELDDLAAMLTTYPQVLVNVRVRERADYTKIPGIADTIRRVEERLHGDGRLLVRYSGTEPLLRIMLEGKDDVAIRQWADEIAAAVRTHIG
jgi:phosphoglucosamine mutase